MQSGCAPHRSADTLSILALTCSFLAGTVVFLGIRGVITPPAVSMPRLRGATSSSSSSCTFSPPAPVRMAACRTHELVSLQALEQQVLFRMAACNTHQLWATQHKTEEPSTALCDCV